MSVLGHLLVLSAAAGVMNDTSADQQKTVEAVAAVLAGQGDVRSVAPFFHRNATFVKGEQVGAWDTVGFRGMIAAQCGKNWKYWSQDRVLSGLAPESAEELKRTGHPKGPGVTFYCKSDGNRIGHAMYTFAFKAGRISQVRQLFFVAPPPPPPPPPVDAAAGDERG